MAFTYQENYEEYLRLQCNQDYCDVRFDLPSGSVSAVHKLHHFDKSRSPYGEQRGTYELHVCEVLRKQGHRVLLLQETWDQTSVKSPDCLLDGTTAEIKTVESSGRWAIRTKIYTAAKQGAEIVLLYFPVMSLFSLERVYDGYLRFISDDECQELHNRITQILCIVENSVVGIK